MIPLDRTPLIPSTSEGQPREGSGSSPQVGSTPASLRTTHDPVCGAKVEAGEVESRSAVFHGTAYSFCSEACRERFEADPEQWVTTH